MMCSVIDYDVSLVMVISVMQKLFFFSKKEEWGRRMQLIIK